MYGDVPVLIYLHVFLLYLYFVFYSHVLFVTFFAILFVFQTEIADTKPPGVFNGQLNLFAFS